MSTPVREIARKKPGAVDNRPVIASGYYQHLAAHRR
jgi:hypothetical protein